MLLEDESSLSIALMSEDKHHSHSRSQVSFFRPVDGNMAHHNLMGDTMDKFDFVIQNFKPLFQDWRDGRCQKVTLITEGTPMTCRLEHLKYADLSTQLMVWTMPEMDYVTSEKM